MVQQALRYHNCSMLWSRVPNTLCEQQRRSHGSVTNLLALLPAGDLFCGLTSGPVLALQSATRWQFWAK